MAVCTMDHPDTRNLLSYVSFTVQEAQCHGGTGWLEYEKWFRQQKAVLTTQHPWNKLS